MSNSVRHKFGTSPRQRRFWWGVYGYLGTMFGDSFGSGNQAAGDRFLFCVQSLWRQTVKKQFWTPVHILIWFNSSPTSKALVWDATNLLQVQDKAGMVIISPLGCKVSGVGKPESNARHEGQHFATRLLVIVAGFVDSLVRLLLWLRALSQSSAPADNRLHRGPEIILEKQSSKSGSFCSRSYRFQSRVVITWPQQNHIAGLLIWAVLAWQQ